MAIQKVLVPGILGKPETLAPINVSAGSADAGKVIRLDTDGKIHESMLPTGIGKDVSVLKASEALAAGDYVNIHEADDGGGGFDYEVRKAVASSNSLRAMGFVLQSYDADKNATVYHEGTNTADPNTVVYTQSNKTVFLSASNSGRSFQIGVDGGALPTAENSIVQKLGTFVGEGVSFEPNVEWINK